jgi:peptidoglycan/LPS O-acetylase OafA/YrhL
VTTSAPQLRPRFDCFDGLRALAALAVVMHHTAYATGATFRDWRGAGDFLARMDVGVAIFFLISGFLLYRPFVVAHLADEPRPATGAYFRRRFLRIFPAYWVALIGIAVFIGFFPGQSLDGIWSWVSHLLLIQVFQPDQFYRGITQAWTLHTELSFYLFLPGYAWAIRRASRSRRGSQVGVEVGGLVVLAVIGMSFNALIQSGWSTYLSEVGKAWLPANLDLFALGMALALVSAHAAGRATLSPALDRVGRVGGWWWVGAAGAFWVVAKPLGLSTAISSTPDLGVDRYAEHILYGLVALCLLLPAVFGTERRGVVRGVLRWAPIVWLGIVSYGIYLWHQGWIKQALAWTGSGAFQGGFWDILAITLACTIPTAALSYSLLERPLLRWRGGRAQPPSGKALEGVDGTTA